MNSQPAPLASGNSRAYSRALRELNDGLVVNTRFGQAFRTRAGFVASCGGTVQTVETAVEALSLILPRPLSPAALFAALYPFPSL